MTDDSPVTLDFKEFAELLIKQRGIHEGLWGIHIKFALSAANINAASIDEPSKARVTPAAIVPVIEIGIRRYKEPTELTVDAAEVNPAPKTAKKAATKKGTRKRANR